MVRNFFAGQTGQGVAGRKLHGFIDLCRACVQGPTKNRRKTQNIIHLIWIIRAARGNDGIGASGAGHRGNNFRIGIGHGKNNWILIHFHQHISSDSTSDRKANDDIGPFHGLGQGSSFSVDSEGFFVFVHSFFAAFVNHTAGIAHH